MYESPHIFALIFGQLNCWKWSITLFTLIRKHYNRLSCIKLVSLVFELLELVAYYMATHCHTIESVL